MAIITISRTFGSLGTEIARSLKEELGFHYLDKESLEEELFKKFGIPEEKVERYDEKKPAFWEIFSSDKDSYIHFMKTAIYEFAQEGNCAIIGRGGQFLFKDIPGVLCVRVIAPAELRIERIKNRYSYNDRVAEELMHHIDHDRAGFHKYFFHINWENNDFYDLVINTKSFSVEAAVHLIKDALESTEIMEKQPEKESKLADLCLGQEVITSIAYMEKVPVRFLEAVAINGIVTLRGSTITTEDVNRCEVVARRVPGVKEVINEIYYLPTTYGMM